MAQPASAADAANNTANVAEWTAADAVYGRITDRTAPMTYDEHVARVASGMESAMHLILCLRGVYPAGAYTATTIRTEGGGGGAQGGAGESVYTAYAPRHPGLKMYFARVREALHTQLVHQDVSAVALLLHLPQSGRVLERYVFRFSYAWPRAPVSHERSVPVSSAWSTADFDRKLAAMMSKLTGLLGTLSPLPLVQAALEKGRGPTTNNPQQKGEKEEQELEQELKQELEEEQEEGGEEAEEVSSAIVLQLRDPSARPSAQPPGARPDPHRPPEGDWVPLDPALAQHRPDTTAPQIQGQGKSKGKGKGSGAQIVPVQSLATGVIDFTFYVEEHAATKARARRHVSRAGKRQVGGY